MKIKRIKNILPDKEDQGTLLQLKRINDHSCGDRGSRTILDDIEDQEPFLQIKRIKDHTCRYKGSRTILADKEDQGAFLKIQRIKHTVLDDQVLLYTNKETLRPFIQIQSIKNYANTQIQIRRGSRATHANIEDPGSSYRYRKITHQ